jgi:flagellar hook-basal body protein
MSFYTALTGLNAATAQMGVTSNNIANVSTTGFKRSRTDFGDIFATSPLQKASSTIGQGVALKRVTQEFSQGNTISSSNTLDMMISGDGFFPLKSQDGFQDIFTRNGVFMMNDQYNVVNSAGQKLMAASVDSSGKANLDDMNVLTIPQKTTGMAMQTSKVQLGLNFPADAEVISKSFNRNDPTTYNKSTALTVYDAGGNSYLASVYYVKTQNASQATPNNKWQTYVYVGDKLVSASLQQATNSTGDVMYVNKYGELKAKSDFKTPAEIAELNSSFSKKTVKFSLDDLTDIRTSQPATVTAGLATSLGTGSNDGVDFSNYINMNKTELLGKQGSSGVTYTLNAPAIDAGFAVTFGPTSARVSVNVDPDGTTAPTALDIATALNKNASFASSYVAQAPSSAEISAVSFASTTPTVNDFKSFSITVNGKVLSFSNIVPATATLQGLADALQARLRNEDKGNADLSVSVVGALGSEKLQIVDAAGRTISAAALQPSDAALADSASGGTVTIPNPTLKITAIDPNLSAVKIGDEFVIKQGTSTISSLDGVFTVSGPTGTALDGSSNETIYPRSVARYPMGTAAPFKATFTGSPTDITVTSDTGDTTLSGFITKLNANEAFSANYKAVISADGLSMDVIAQDPTVSSPTAITGDVKIFNTDTNGFSQITTGITTNAPVSGGANQLDPDYADANGAIKSYSGKHSIDELKNLFTVNVDGSLDGVSVGLDGLIASMKNVPTANQKLSGTQIAAELTNAIQRAYGDEKPFNFSTVGTPTFSLQLTLSSNKSTLDKLNINLSDKGDLKPEDLVREVQKQINDDTAYKGKITVSYDTQAQKLVFAPTGSNKIAVSSDQTAIGLTDPLVQGVNDESVGLSLSPSVSTSPFRALNDQRYGMKVEYDAVKQSFVFKSGSTGDTSSIVISDIRPGSLATQSAKGLGMTGDPASYTVAASSVDALRGITSKPASLTGNALAINVDNNFSVDSTNNQFVVSVNGITGTVTVPPKDTYTLGTFMEALQNGINNLQSATKNGLTPESVNGVKVSYNSAKNALEFTTGTASTDSYIKVTGDAKWGLDGLDAAFGSTTTWIKPKPFTDEKGATVYIDGFGAETSSATGFETLPSWSPVYFDKGELTFDTAGNLVSPKQGAQLDTVYLPNGKGALTINIDYSKSTQYASPFSVLSQSQDGAPEGDLVGLAIKDDGLVQASYSNGAQKSLAKVVLVNFSNPSGLRQIGDTNYYKTSDSGTPKYGEAGSAGFGTVRSGATERANVDLTQELVDLITEQRNFQANAKAMETSTSMTNTIIQIRN